MDVKKEDQSEESKKNHIAYYKSLSKVISDIQQESKLGVDPTIKNHLDEGENRMHLSATALSIKTSAAGSWYRI